MGWGWPGGTDRNIFTLEDDGTHHYIRKYDDSGNLLSTLYTDTNKAKTPIGSIPGVWLVVVPE